MTWDFVVVENLYRDHNGFKYVQLLALDKSLDIQKQKVLFTFIALTQWLCTKPKRKELLLEAGKTYTTLVGKAFIRPQNIVRFNSTLINAGTADPK